MSDRESSAVRQAVRWISDQRLENPQAKVFELLTEASRRYDLTPRQEAELFAVLTEGRSARRPDEE